MASTQKLRESWGDINELVRRGGANCRDQYSDFLKSEKTLLNEAILKLENTHYLFFKGSTSLEEKTSVYDPHVALQLI